MNAFGTASRTGSGDGTTAASATAGCLGVERFPGPDHLPQWDGLLHVAGQQSDPVHRRQVPQRVGAVRVLDQLEQQRVAGRVSVSGVSQRVSREASA
jgi:hypothetical protein